MAVSTGERYAVSSEGVGHSRIAPARGMLPVFGMRMLLLLTALAACGEQETPEVMLYQDRPPIIHTTADAGLPPTPLPTSQSALGSGVNPNVDMCRLLPDDDSACAHACDPAALKEYVPQGTCASFTCTLTDGTVFRIGACNT